MKLTDKAYMKLLLTALLAAPFLISCNPSSTGKKAKVNDSNTTVEDPFTPGEDPLASFAWHLHNIGQTTFSSGAGTSGQDMNIKEVHDSGIFGAGVRIAVSDSGVDAYHPDLEDNQLVALHRDYSSDNSANWAGGNPYPIEEEAHGTAVAGLAAAAGWNGQGSRGVAPSAQFAGFLFLGNFHTTATSYEAKTLDQLTGDFDIFNYSYGYAGCEFSETSSSVISAYQAGVTNLRLGKGAIYVKAAGNDYIGTNEDCTSSDTSSYLGNTNTNEDQNIPHLILTGALNARGEISSYSTPGSGLWVSTAGGEFGTTSPAMLTTDIRGCSKGYSSTMSPVAGFNLGNSSHNPNCNYTSIMNGTSSAAPVLSGIIAQMLEANPNLAWRDVKHILAETADPISFSTAALDHPGGTSWSLSGHIYDYLYVTNSAGYSFSNTFGFGRVNALNAVNMALTYTSSLGTYKETIDNSTGEWLYDSGILNLTIPDRQASGVSNVINVTHAYIIESVQIKLTTDHNYLGDIAVELTSPSGITSKIILANSNINDSGLSDFLLLTNAFYGETSNGNWTIKVIDAAARGTGRLVSWKLKVNGH
jgi:subtilisin family serine protease